MWLRWENKGQNHSEWIIQNESTGARYLQQFWGLTAISMGKSWSRGGSWWGGTQGGSGPCEATALLRPPSTSLPAQLSYLCPAGLPESEKREAHKIHIGFFTLLWGLSMLNKDQGCLCSFVPFPLTPSDLCIVDAQKNEFYGRILREKSKEKAVPAAQLPVPSNQSRVDIHVSFSWMRFSLWPLPAWPMWLHMMEWREAEGRGECGSWGSRAEGPYTREVVKSKALHALPVGQVWIWGWLWVLTEHNFTFMWLR